VSFNHAIAEFNDIASGEFNNASAEFNHVCESCASYQVW
jgi:hypothetical protein